MSTLPTQPSTGDLSHTRHGLIQELLRFVSRGRLLGRLHRLMHSGCWALLCVLIFCLADAIVVLSTALRFVAMGATTALLIVAAVRTLFIARSGSRDLLATGSRLASHEKDPNEAVLLGLGMELHETDNDPIYTALVRRSLDRARQAAQAIRPNELLPLATLSRPLSRLWLVVAASVVIGLIFPGLLSSGIARMAQPRADIPAFNLTTLEVTWTPQAPRPGQGVTISAKALGISPGTVQLVVLDHDGSPLNQQTMTRDSDGRLLAQLHTTDKPIRFTFDVHGRRTAIYTIHPEQEPRPNHKKPSPEDETTDTLESHPGSETQGLPSDQSAQNTIDATVEQLQDLADRLDVLRQRMLATDPADARQMQALADDIRQWAWDADALSQAIKRSAPSDLPADMATKLEEISDALAGLQLSGLAQSPTPDQLSPEAGGEAAGQSWLDAAHRAAAQDHATLASGIGNLDEATESGTPGIPNAQGEDAPSIPRDPAAGGNYNATIGTSDSGNLPEATLRQVPARYREHVAAYFRSLAEHPAPERK